MSILPSPSGLSAQYFGKAGGATARYYWIQAIYESGNSPLAAFPVLANTAISLTQTDRVNLSWQPVPGALYYKVYQNTVNTLPQGSSNLLVLTTAECFAQDYGQAYLTDTVRYPGLLIWRSRYNFTVDGGLVAAITPVDSDTIPANAILLGAIVNSPVAVTSGGAATVSIGTVAGSSATSILAATGKASFTIDAVLNGSVTFATPVKMTAAGQINFTVGTAALTTGQIEVFVIGVVSSVA